MFNLLIFMLWQRNVEVRKKVEVKECNLVKPI
nr:MAG TPA: hypothetical protein [Crassvirales sp.]